MDWPHTPLPAMPPNDNRHAAYVEWRRIRWSDGALLQQFVIHPLMGVHPGPDYFAEPSFWVFRSVLPDGYHGEVVDVRLEGIVGGV